MPYTRTVAPSAAVSLAEAKAHLRIDYSDDDDLIQALINAATATIDGRDGWLGRALLTQTWQYTGPAPSPQEIADFRFLARWPATYVRLELPPVASLVSVEALQSGTFVTQTLGNYALRKMKGYSVVRPAMGLSWPTFDDDEECLRITFVTGDTALPAPIHAAILLMIGDLYANREATVIDNGRATLVINPTCMALLKPYQAWTV